MKFIEKQLCDKFKNEYKPTFRLRFSATDDN